MRRKGTYKVTFAQHAEVDDPFSPATITTRVQFTLKDVTYEEARRFAHRAVLTAPFLKDYGVKDFTVKLKHWQRKESSS